MDNRKFGNPADPAFRIEKYPFYLLNRLVSRYNSTILTRLRTIGLDIPSWRVLMVLGELSPRGVREISEEAVIPLSTTTRIIQRMTQAGLIAISQSKSDGRVTEAALSEAGREKLVEAKRESSVVYAQIIAGLSSDDFNNLLLLLDRMHVNIDPYSKNINQCESDYIS